MAITGQPGENYSKWILSFRSFPENSGQQGARFLVMAFCLQ